MSQVTSVTQNGLQVVVTYLNEDPNTQNFQNLADATAYAAAKTAEIGMVEANVNAQY